jgi:hypothetical protein
MPRFRVDDDIHSHPKAIMAGDEAMGLWLRAGSFSMAYGTDGFIPDWWIAQQIRGKVKANRLVSAQLWHRGEYSGSRPEFQGQTGCNFHDWQQDSYEKVEADRRKWRIKKAAQRNSSPEVSPGDTTGDSQGESRESPGYIPNTHTQVTTDVVTSSGASRRAKPRKRIADDYMPPRDVIDAIRAETGASDEQMRRQHRKFVDYWQGTGKPMADWDATWRRWMRTAHERGDFGATVSVLGGAPARPSKARILAELAARTREEEQRQGLTTVNGKAIAQ